MKILKRIVIFMTLCCCLTAGSAGATPITSPGDLPGGTIVTMPTIKNPDYLGQGPIVFNSNITWTSTVPSVFGFVGTFSYENPEYTIIRYWDSALGSIAGLNNVSGVMTFEFATPVKGVGGFLNYGVDYGNPTIAVYDSSHKLLEAAVLNFTRDGQNNGQFLGFLESDPIIKYFTMENSYIGITGLTLDQSGPVPEPCSFLLLGAGISGLLLRKRRNKAHKL